MDVLEAIHTRRSIRAYQDQPVPKELVQQILTAAMYAPSAGNAQPWQFVVINDRKLLQQIPKVHPHAPMAEQAPLAIMVCGDLDMEKYPGNWPLDCAAAVENLLLAAEPPPVAPSGWASEARLIGGGSHREERAGRRRGRP